MEKLYTAKEVAEMLRVSRTIVSIWLNTGKLRGFKVGTLWRIKESDLEAFLKEPSKDDRA